MTKMMKAAPMMGSNLGRTSAGADDVVIPVSVISGGSVWAVERLVMDVVV